MNEDEYKEWKEEQLAKQKEYRRKIYLAEKEKKQALNKEEKKKKKEEKNRLKQDAAEKRRAELWKTLLKGSDLETKES